MAETDLLRLRSDAGLQYHPGNVRGQNYEGMSLPALSAVRMLLNKAKFSSQLIPFFAREKSNAQYTRANEIISKMSNKCTHSSIKLTAFITKNYSSTTHLNVTRPDSQWDKLVDNM